ncbi:MAG TPA: DNA repair protein RadC [Thermoanaerobaculia bacterium]|jgi:DNA repair protein RadC
MTDKICDLPPDDRPRERLIAHGAETLSDSELIAILIGSGMRGKNALQIARELVQNRWARLRDRDINALARMPGLGPAKAARIHVALEIGRRIASNRPQEPPPLCLSVLGPQLVNLIGQQSQERLGAVFLDSRHRVLKQRNDIYVGTIDNALVSTRDIIRFALEDNATALILYHNHPSGTASPSQEDREFTAKLRTSLGYIDIDLVDHLIVGPFGYCSMKDCGYFND